MADRTQISKTVMASVYRFGPFQLDVGARELRRGADEIPVQPQVFALLHYLLEHRDRVVGKDELLGRLWPDAVVLEGSLQRSVSQARAALGDDAHAFIRTFSRHGYRFVGPVEEVAPTASGETSRALPPLTVRYARSGGLHLAYATAGAGAVDIVLVLGWTFPFRALARLPESAGTRLDGHRARRAVRQARHGPVRSGQAAAFTRRAHGRSAGRGLALAEAWPSLRLAAHVGEVETAPGGGAVGPAVDDGAAILAGAIPGQLWISRVLADLLPGSGFVFEAPPRRRCGARPDQREDQRSVGVAQGCAA